MHGEMSLYHENGSRKYVTAAEGQRFIEAAGKLDQTGYALCLTLVLTGCRLSEALALTRHQIDDALGCLHIRTLKRRKQVWRQVPVPTQLSQLLLGLPVAEDGRVFGFSRQTGWRKVKAAMREAGVEGAFASPKGLRHRFGVVAASERVPMGLLQQWLGHAKLETTVIYQQVMGEEERLIAKRMWQAIPGSTD